MITRNLLVLTLLGVAPFASADAAAQFERGGRAEIWLNVTSWPALREIEPAAGGLFDATGFGLGGGVWIVLRQFERSELLWGIDGFIAANESNIEGIFDELLARQLYLGGSLKWALGEERSYSLDAGLGYHLVDMAEVGDYGSGIEREVWETSRTSAYLGATWDLPPASLGSRGRWMLGIKAYFADFGTVNGPGPVGPDAGRLDGPLYTLQVGYGVR